ncbi:MAG: response regulator [Burkholderiales bacterium]|nr:response regulator [Burkholderiales bacterium]
MATPDDDFSDCSALVVDGNPTSRSILVSQLREFGVGTVVQAARAADARRQLEFKVYDFVLCELHFPDEASSGQDLLDDLRRSQLLPYSTIFIMVTGEATYARVAEAAESALDGYLLKPHRAIDLAERLLQARVRKISLQGIFTAIGNEDFEEAARLCMERFESKGKFWLYAARVGAELLLRLDRPNDAQQVYRAIVAAKTLPWARLGVARAQLDAGQVSQATSTLENLISDEPNFVDAYDVMGRAQFELGRLDKALETYKMAARLTPASITRLQNLAMMSYYAGDHEEAEKLLDRTARRGLESKMFDSQCLVLLAFTRLESGDRKGLQRCQDDFGRLMEKSPDNPRLKRLSDIVTVLHLMQQHQFAQAVASVRDLARTVSNSEFDFESASNVLALMAQLATKTIQLQEVDSVVETIGLRFCSNRSQTELLAACAKAHPPYAQRMQTCQAQVLAMAEAAMALSLSGDPAAAVSKLMQHGRTTLNARLIDNAHQVLLKHTSKIANAAALAADLQELRAKFGTQSVKAAMGEQKRQSGGLVLRTGSGGPNKVPSPGGE